MDLSYVTRLLGQHIDQAWLNTYSYAYDDSLDRPKTDAKIIC